MNRLKFKIKNLILAIFGAFSLLLICITLLLQYNYSYSVVEKSTSSLIDRITINTTQQLHDFEDKMALEILKSAKEDKKTALLDGKEYLLSQSTLSSNFGLNHKIVLLSSKDAAFSDFNQAIIMEIATAIDKKKSIYRWSLQ